MNSGRQEIVAVDVNEVNTSLTVYENKMLGYMAAMGLPVDGILVPIRVCQAKCVSLFFFFYFRSFVR